MTIQIGQVFVIVCPVLWKHRRRYWRTMCVVASVCFLMLLGLIRGAKTWYHVEIVTILLLLGVSGPRASLSAIFIMAIATTVYRVVGSWHPRDAELAALSLAFLTIFTYTLTPLFKIPKTGILPLFLHTLLFFFDANVPISAVFGAMSIF